VNLLEDVAAGAELAQVVLPPLGELPRDRRYALRESEPFEVLEARQQRGVINRSAARGRRAGIDAPILNPPLDVTVERGESLLVDFLDVGATNFELVAGPELLGGELLGAPA
jgi:hypothetical protein